MNSLKGNSNKRKRNKIQRRVLARIDATEQCVPALWPSDDSVDEFSETEANCKETSGKRTYGKDKNIKRKKVFIASPNSEKLGLLAHPTSSKLLAVQKSKVREVLMFLQQWEEGKVPKALVICGPPGCGKTTLVHTVVQETGRSIINRSRNLLQNHVQPISHDEDMDDILTSSRYLPLCTEECSSKTDNSGHVLLVDDIILPRNQKAMQELEDDLEILATQTVYPTIIIITCSTSSWKIFERNRTQNSDNFQWLPIHPVTNVEMRKALTRYCQLCGRKDFSEEDLETIIESSRGDLRCALSYLDLYSEQHSSWSRKTHFEAQDSIRSYVYDIWRAIGKIFYNKRAQANTPKDSIWSIVSRLEEPTNKIIRYLTQNCHYFFGNIGDISEFLQHLCDAYSFAKWYSSGADWELAQYAAQIVAGEAARACNKEPIKNGFQPIRWVNNHLYICFIDIYSC
eukprot:jgi/Galph1/2109/GphlegSOOS_G781.1